MPNRNYVRGRDKEYRIFTPKQIRPFSENSKYIVHHHPLPPNFKFRSRKKAIWAAYREEDKIKEQTGLDVDIEVYWVEDSWELKR